MPPPVTWAGKMNRRWRIASALVLVGFYLLTGAVASRWWMGLGQNASLWGTHPTRGNFSWEPIITVLIFAVPPAAISLVTRSRLVHAWLLIVCAYQLSYGVHYALHGVYFGCDRNGCSAEEGFFFGNILTVFLSVFGAALIRFIVMIVDDIRDTRRRKALVYNQPQIGNPTVAWSENAPQDGFGAKE
jgi:hypothetical protein